MKRSDFLKSLGFGIAASACHPRLVLGKSVPTPSECDGERIHFSDCGFYMVSFSFGVPMDYHALFISYDSTHATSIPWPDYVVPFLEI